MKRLNILLLVAVLVQAVVLFMQRIAIGRMAEKNMAEAEQNSRLRAAIAQLEQADSELKRSDAELKAACAENMRVKDQYIRILKGRVK